MKRWLPGLAVICCAALPMAQARQSGQVSGRIVDPGHGAMPGVRVTIVGGETRREVVTDVSGRFVVDDLAPGKYVVTSALPGFFTRTDQIELPAHAPRAYVDWTLEIGCLSEEVRVEFDARTAARQADAIMAVRIEANNGDVHWSREPRCPRTVGDRLVSGVAPAIGRRSPGESVPFSGHVRIFVSPHSGEASVGRQYIAFLWETRHLSDVWSTGGQRLLPVSDSGRVAAGWERALDGLTVRDALVLLERWSRERPQR